MIIDKWINKIHLAYLAGILDGEGYVGIKKSTYGMRVTKDCRNPIYGERIQVRMKDEEPIKLFKEVFGGSYYKEKCSGMYCYQASNLIAIKIINALLPFIRVKNKECELLLKLRESKNDSRSLCRGSPAKRTMAKDIVEFRENLYLEVKKLHGH